MTVRHLAVTLGVAAGDLGGQRPHNDHEIPRGHPAVTARYLTVNTGVAVRYLKVIAVVTVRYLTVTDGVAARYLAGSPAP